MPAVIDLSNQASDASDSEEEPLSRSATSRGAAPDNALSSTNSSAPSSPSRFNRRDVSLQSRPRSLLDPAQASSSSSVAAAAAQATATGNSSTFSSRGSTPGVAAQAHAQPRSFFRSTLSIPSGAGPSRQRYDPRPRDNEVIELSDDSDDDFEVTGGRAAPPPRSASGRRVRGAPRARIDHTEFRRASEELDQVLQQRREAMQDLARVNNQERDNVRERLDRELHSPPPPAPRIGLGGAVFRAGDRAVRFAPGRPTMRYRLRGDEQDEEQRERIQPPRAARLGGAFAPGAGNLGAAAAHQTYMQGLGGLFAGRAENIMNALLNPLNYVGGAGPRAQPVQDMQAVLAKVTPEKVPPAQRGFTRTWDAEALVEEGEKQRGIVLDDTGDVVKQQIKPYLSCSACPEPLRLGSAARDDNDRIFALRCGHLLDGKCLGALAFGPSEDTAPPSKKRKTRSGNKTREHVFLCPVKGCGREHVSVLVNDQWGQKEGVGAVQVYV